MASKLFVFLAGSLALIGIADAFMAPRTCGSSVSARGSIWRIQPQQQQQQLNAHPLDLDLFDATNHMLSSTSLILSDEAVSAAADAAAAAPSDVDTDSLLSGLRTFFAVLTGLIFGAFGLTYFVAAFIVPKAAEQLEKDTRRLRPGLWEEYEAKLEPGQTMATRPDILQELGEVMRPIILDDFETSAAQQEADKKAGIVDATVVEEKKDKEAPPLLDVNDQWKD